MDLREEPSYRIAEAAHYLLIPTNTLRAWVVGQRYRTQTGWRPFKPLIRIADRGRGLLSFVNLVEAHVLDAIRRQHRLPMQKVRRSLDVLERLHRSEHPLAELRFKTNGVDLFLQDYARLISLSESGQIVLREAIDRYLDRVVWDKRGLPVQLYPYTRKRAFDEPKSVVIDPAMSFGRPSIAETGIATSIVAERYKAGDSIEALADDYGVPATCIQEAIRCELQVDAA